MHAHARHRYVNSWGGENRHQTCPDFFFLSPALGRGNADLKKQCLAVPFTCSHSECQGDPTTGCASGGPNDGCPCEGPSGPPSHQGPKIICDVIKCSDPKCEGYLFSPFCLNPASLNCPCTRETSNSANPNCPSAISCSDASCGGYGGQCRTTSLAGCSCGTDISGPEAPNCQGLSKCSDPSCGGSLLDGSAPNGSGKLGTCSASSHDGCPCRDT